MKTYEEFFAGLGVMFTALTIAAVMVYVITGFFFMDLGNVNF
jgi:hypothetical protein